MEKILAELYLLCVLRLFCLFFGEAVSEVIDSCSDEGFEFLNEGGKLIFCGEFGGEEGDEAGKDSVKTIAVEDYVHCNII